MKEMQIMDFTNRAKIYNTYRKADYRMTEKIIELLSLEKNSTVVDIGAGTGNYSLEIRNQGYNVIAVEPSRKMIENCVDKSLVYINSPAECIELDDNLADGAIIINAIHHFKDVYRSLYEINRIIKSGTLLIFTFDPKICGNLWLYDYWPHSRMYLNNFYMDIDTLKDILFQVYETKVVEEIAFDIPIDFEDTFSSALWGRPYLLLENERRLTMSLFNFMDSVQMKEGIEKLQKDLRLGIWQKKYAYLLNKQFYDVGCRFLKLYFEPKK